MAGSSDEGPLVAVVDDEALQRDVVADYLKRQGMRATALDGGSALRRQFEREPPDVVLLDLRMPGEDGLTLARWVRERHPAVGVIMVTASGDTVDRVAGLEIGADDYVVKPFNTRELLARVKTVLRRVKSATTRPTLERRVAMGATTFDTERRVLVAPDGAESKLTASEHDLLRLFAENPNRPLSRDWLLQMTSHREMDAFDRAIDLRITRLRKKIERDPARPETIRTVRNVGYMFVPPGGG